MEILKGTEKDTRNIFGQYGSKRMKDWLEVLRMYEKDNVYLGEAAQILIRNVNYEIPGLKKSISKFEQMGDEAEKKIHDSIKSENILRNEFNASCQQFGIKGENIKEELIEKIKELPELQEKVTKMIPDLKKSVELYSNFSTNKGCLPIIRHIIESGNTTVYQYLYSEPPLTIEEPPLKFLSEDLMGNEPQETDNGGETDFGDVGSGEIDFGETEADPNLECGEIDWGGHEEPVGDGNSEIDFGVSLEESGIVVEGRFLLRTSKQ